MQKLLATLCLILLYLWIEVLTVEIHILLLYTCEFNDNIKWNSFKLAIFVIL